VNSLPQPSASIHLRHAVEEGNNAKGCFASTGDQSGDALTERSQELEEKGYQPNTSGGGVGPRNQRLESYTSPSTEKREKMLRLAELQKKIVEAAEEMCHIGQDDQGRGPQHRELCQETPINDDGCYDYLYHGNFAFDDASPLSAELQATPWPPSYKLSQLPMYDGHSDPKQFLMSYETTISSYGGNTPVMAKSFVMAVRSVAQTWYSSL
jgi:hypothetical protein